MLLLQKVQRSKKRRDEQLDLDTYDRIYGREERPLRFAAVKSSQW